MPGDDLSGRLAAIEHAVDNGSYRPGPWQALTRDIRNSMFFERAAVSDDVSRVSRKLHLRKPRRRVSMNAGLLLAIVGINLGGLVMIVGVGMRSNLLSFLGALFWMVTFQILVKAAVGRAMGVHYEYLYLLAFEPRIKMKYGTYLSRPRLLRNILHLSGTIGSPLAAYLSYFLLSHTLAIAGDFCLGAFWLLVVVNVVSFVAAIAGMHRLGPLPLSLSSGGSAAYEIREGLGR